MVPGDIALTRMPRSLSSLAQVRAKDHIAAFEASDPELLARYLMTVANGIAVQAASGTGRDQLQQVAGMALRSWPTA